MKDKENIKQINKLSMSYIMLKGLKGKVLEKDNPFLTYLMYKMIINGYNNSTDNDLNNIIYLVDNEEDDNQKGVDMIPNVLFHKLIETSYEMYKNIDDIKSSIDPQINEQISVYLDDKDNFIDELIDKYRKSMVFILLNYNSKKETYNNIKIDILKEELKIVVDLEDYNTAIVYRDKIKETEQRIDENKEVLE